ncbi:MAG TPA: tetratricopeptide repeat protein [Xanthobacteraceae bacterium]|nr:tetratricopeptide repeat protein [Xanthobacteraceae bacterium]
MSVAGESGAQDLAERALADAFREHQAGRFAAAVEHYRRALAIRPGFPEALNNLGIALKDMGRFEEAILAYREALRLQPNRPEIINNLGDSLHSLGNRAEAIEHYRKAVAIRPDYAIAWRNLGDALAEVGRHDEAMDCAAKAVAHAPQLDASLTPAEIAVRETQRLFASYVEGIELAAKRDPLLAAAYLECGSGRPLPKGAGKQAVERWRHAARLRDGYASHLSGLLLVLHYDQAVNSSFLYDAHREVQRFSDNLPRFTTFANTRDPERRLRVGYVSADFRIHSVGYFLSGVFRGHDPAAVETYCYSGGAEEDELTSFFKSKSAAWRPTAGIADDDLAAAMRSDGIDILVDLSGHTGGNRLAVFARRSAPIQVTWLGYPDTTGLSAVDFRLTDAIVDPPGPADSLSSERLVRLPGGFNCYTAPDGAPDVAPLPAIERGFITFGSFNNLAKINADVLDLWAAVLKQVQGSRLILKHRWLAFPEMRARMRRLLEQRGIAGDRVELLGKLKSTADHLAAYGSVDIALDTFPYNGATTTCEALWMGVPVVTLGGDRHSARMGASLLARAGLEHLVASTPQAYVDVATRLAADLSALASLRADLRGRVAASPLCDSVKFCRQLEAAYRTMWREWCRSPSSQQQV